MFQEAVLAPNSMCVLGGHSIDLLDVARAAHWIALKEMFKKRSPGLAQASKLFDYIDKDHGLFAKGSSGLVAFAQLMMDAWELSATDPRDRVDAILGLKVWPEGIPRLLKPDYNKSGAEVFRDASRYSLQAPDEDGLIGWEDLTPAAEDLKRGDFVSWVIYPAKAYDPT